MPGTIRFHRGRRRAETILARFLSAEYRGDGCCCEPFDMQEASPFRARRRAVALFRHFGLDAFFVRNFFGPDGVITMPPPDTARAAY